jgi:hypothetical protein
MCLANLFLPAPSLFTPIYPFNLLSFVFLYCNCCLQASQQAVFCQYPPRPLIVMHTHPPTQLLICFSFCTANCCLKTISSALQASQQAVSAAASRAALRQRQQEQLAALLGSERVLSGVSARRLALGHHEQVRTVEPS